jgi:hypothetical protein
MQTREEFLAHDPRLTAAKQALDAAQNALSNGTRWGETRRFAGRRAGNRLDHLESARIRWSKAYDKATALYDEQCSRRQNAEQ